MSGTAILILVVGCVLFPVSFVLTAWRFCRLPEHLMPEARLPSSRTVMWSVGLILIIASFLI